MATSRKKAVLTIKEKYLALKELEKEGTSKKSIAEKYGVPPNTLSYWIKNKADIFTNYESGQYGAKRQKLSSAKYDNIDKAVYKWFVNARERNVPISGQIIREKALDFAKQFNEPDFKASEGWLDKWKHRLTSFSELFLEKKSLVHQQAGKKLWNLSRRIKRKI